MELRAHHPSLDSPNQYFTNTSESTCNMQRKWKPFSHTHPSLLKRTHADATPQRERRGKRNRKGKIAIAQNTNVLSVRDAASLLSSFPFPFLIPFPLNTCFLRKKTFFPSFFSCQVFDEFGLNARALGEGESGPRPGKKVSFLFFSFTSLITRGRTV